MCELDVRPGEKLVHHVYPKYAIVVPENEERSPSPGFVKLEVHRNANNTEPITVWVNPEFLSEWYRRDEKEELQ